jgi:hypothetical protein
MDSAKVAEVVRTIPPATLAGRIRRVLEDIQELRKHEYTYEQIVEILRDKYKVIVTPADDTKRAARNLSATICQIMKAKRKPPVTPPLSLPGMEEAARATSAVTNSGVDVRAHGEKVLADAKRKIQESKKSIFALAADREEGQ